MFLIFHGFDPNNGISKKISYQVEALKACGREVHLCYVDETTGRKLRMVDGEVIADYGSGIRSKILKRIECSSITDYVRNHQIGLVYIRSNHNANPFTICMVKRMKQAGARVVMEIPTYPYDAEYIAQGIERQIIQDRLFRNRLAKHLDAIVTFSDNDVIFGQRTIKISNGIDFDSIPVKTTKNDTTRELNLIGVAEIHRWHGFDRLLRGLAQYYAAPREYKVYFYVVGYFFSTTEEEEITAIIRENKLEPYVILYGKKHGQKLDDIFNKCDFGIGSLGRHRVGISDIKTLKNREYAARGIPFVYSENDADFDQKSYVLKVPADESPVNIENIIAFYRQLTMTPQQIRSSISNLSWKHQMKRVLEKKKSICFLTDSVFSVGGVQRVTAVIAKELAKENDVTIVTLDKPEMADTSLYGLEQQPIHYRFFSYPQTPKLKYRCCKAYSYLYRRILPHTRLTSDWYSHSSFPSEKRNALGEELKNGRYDTIIGVHAPLAVRLAACKPQLGRTRLIGWIHNSYEALFGEGSRYMGPELRKHCEYQLEKLDATVVLCHHDAQQYQFPTQVIYNPLTLTPGALSDGTAKKFLAVGRFAPRHKGFDLLIEAFRLFAQRNEEWTLDIVGEGVEEPTYREMIRAYALEDRISLHPFTNMIQAYYSAAEVYVLSSRWEGMPLVLMEAMSHGLPVVASDLPVCKEIMNDAGLYFTNGDVHDLARQLEAATTMDWKQKSAEACSIAEHFKVENVISQWKNII